MSCDIRKYRSMNLGGGDYDMYLTAFVGGEKHGAAIQFTIGDKYCALSQDALLDLTDVILKRIEGKDGYRATERERDDIEYREEGR
jgi:hypothetical protein